MAAVGEWLRARKLKVWAMGLSTRGTMALVTAGKHDWMAGAIALSPFAHAEMIRDKGGATLREISGGDHRLQTIDRPALFERIKQLFTQA